MEQFRKNLKKLMDLRGFDQGKLAERAGIDRSQISRYLRGAESGRFPRLDNLIKMAEALKVTLEELTGLESLRDIEKEAEEINEISPEEEALLKAYDELPDDDPRKKAIDELLLLGAKKKPRNKK